MKRIQYSIFSRETGNASGKAKRDASEIAMKMGFISSYSPSKNQAIRILQQIITLPKFREGKIIFFQYPAVSKQLMKMFKYIASPRSYKIALIHDIPCLRELLDTKQNEEVDFLNIFDCIIVHNEKMKEYVLKIGYKGKIVILELFDYLHDVNRSISNKPFSNTISFAGNLDKALFIKSLKCVNKCKCFLYGEKSRIDFSSVAKKNIHYKGLLPSDEIQYLMEGDYGLVWDGDSIEMCTGLNGEYLKYNNPHKLSCYIAAGKPIITWKQAAIADFVEKYHIGLTVESLEELNNLDLKENYDEMKLNVMRLKKEIAAGKFLEKAINKALEFRMQ